MPKVVAIIVLMMLVAGLAFSQETPAPVPPAAPEPAPAPRVRVRAPRRAVAPAAPAVAQVFVYGAGSYLGVDSRDITPERARDLKLKEVRGVEVLMVDQDAPAGKAGLKEKDVILNFNGTPVESVEQLRRLLRETPPGREVTIAISRDGQPMNLKVTLADRRRASRLPKDFVVPIPKIPTMPDFEFPSFTMMPMSRRSGLTVESLSPQLGEFFGCKDARGVLVRSVQQDSPAAKAGIRAGDVIVKVDNENIDGTSDFSRAVRRTGKHNVVVLRDRREVSLSLEIPDRTRGDADVQGLFGGDFEQLSLEMAQLQPQFRRLHDELERSMRARQGSFRELERTMRERELELRKAMRELQRQFDQQRSE